MRPRLRKRQARGDPSANRLSRMPAGLNSLDAVRHASAERRRNHRNAGRRSKVIRSGGDTIRCVGGKKASQVPRRSA